jgi:hypothetical protein
MMQDLVPRDVSVSSDGLQIEKDLREIFSKAFVRGERDWGCDDVLTTGDTAKDGAVGAGDVDLA